MHGGGTTSVSLIMPQLMPMNTACPKSTDPEIGIADQLKVAETFSKLHPNGMYACLFPPPLTARLNWPIACHELPSHQVPTHLRQQQ